VHPREEVGDRADDTIDLEMAIFSIRKWTKFTDFSGKDRSKVFRAKDCSRFSSPLHARYQGRLSLLFSNCLFYNDSSLYFRVVDCRFRRGFGGFLGFHHHTMLIDVSDGHTLDTTRRFQRSQGCNPISCHHCNLLHCSPFSLLLQGRRRSRFRHVF
jgi:hypothetical protein